MIAQSGIHPAKLIREGRKEEYIRILMEGIRPIAKAFDSKARLGKDFRCTIR